MESTPITTIFIINTALQKLTAADGPTALIVGYVHVKTLSVGLLEAHPENPAINLAVDLLTAYSWEEASDMLEYYTQDQEQDYSSAFLRLQAVVDSAVNSLQRGSLSAL